MNTAKSPGAVEAHGALKIDLLGSAVSFSPTLDGKSPQVVPAKLSGDGDSQVDPRLVFFYVPPLVSNWLKPGNCA